MIFEVDSAILEAEELHHLLLEVTATVWGSEMGRHQWYIQDPATFAGTKWFAQYLSQPQKKDFEKSVTKSALGNPKREMNFFPDRHNYRQLEIGFQSRGRKKTAFQSAYRCRRKCWIRCHIRADHHSVLRQ